ncbi:uracil-DNA glycosylase [Clostridium psychrophilum]|uniref:uracil-DNA glycosylase n=1 Tax=Clostridium psychrophilum TaxID=132926 RepID=UPI001C0B56CA|nr:uracil-DNA glycosylase [Clostridium psychrophilum]MBU3181544.1 uracil-DNA glycosylase [Clostridium psychrophilum]
MVDWTELEKMCNNCTKCDLHKTKTNMVFGQGDIHTNLMFIGEAPGEQEDLSGIPFVGKSGQLFDKILTSVDISREEIYIANIIKCRPSQNRNPLDIEKKSCLPFLRNQVKLIHPKIIVCLGRVSAQSIINPNFKITKEHGIWFYRKGYCLIATYHPSALLRDPSKKRDAWEDFKTIKTKYDEFREKN